MSTTPASLGGLLREARGSQSVTQSDLALQLGVSQRHVSFVESDRARPSRPLLMAWLQAVQAPIALCNAALRQAGYASHAAARSRPDGDGGSDELLSARALLAAHEPWPAICVDADWMLVAANTARVRLQRLMMPSLPPRLRDADHGIDMIELLIHPGGLLDQVRDAPRIAWSLLGQLRAEAWAHTRLRPRVDDYEQQLRQRHARPAAGVLRPVGLTQLRLDFDGPAGPLSFDVSQLVLGLPQNVTPQSLRVTLWYPTDARTRAVLAR